MSENNKKKRYFIFFTDGSNIIINNVHYINDTEDEVQIFSHNADKTMNSRYRFFKKNIKYILEQKFDGD